MGRSVRLGCGACALLGAVTFAGPGRADDREGTAIRGIVTEAVAPVMQRFGVPGMAVGIVEAGEGVVFNFGVESRESGKPVDSRTLFEIGSLSKTFTATLAAYAEVTGHLSLADTTAEHLPALQGSPLGAVTLLELGTHTPGGMPLQFPDEVAGDDGMIRFFRSWTPSYPPGTTRTYANPSIGLLGLIAAGSLGAPFDEAMQRDVFAPLGLTHSFLTVPPAEQAHYAQGYTAKDLPVRLSPGMLASEAYGVRTTAADAMRFVEANIGSLDVPGDLGKAIRRTHTGFFEIGGMTQDLIWEQYRYPATLQDLQTGNSARISLEPNPARRLDPPLPPQADVLINKTGSTNGFAAYAAFVPGRRIGVVLLANKNYPIDARVALGDAILTRIDGGADRP